MRSEKQRKRAILSLFFGCYLKMPYLCRTFPAPVAELADALDLGSSEAIRAGSIPVRRTFQG